MDVMPLRNSPIVNGPKIGKNDVTNPKENCFPPFIHKTKKLHPLNYKHMTQQNVLRGCSVSPTSASPPTVSSPPLPIKLPPSPFDFYTTPLHHCQVEDLTELAPATPLLFLIPEDYSLLI
eukprot:scaffold238491_cov47-Attheya_sp.AAC.1